MERGSVWVNKGHFKYVFVFVSDESTPEKNSKSEDYRTPSAA